MFDRSEQTQKSSRASTSDLPLWQRVASVLVIKVILAVLGLTALHQSLKDLILPPGFISVCSFVMCILPLENMIISNVGESEMNDGFNVLGSVGLRFG